MFSTKLISLPARCLIPASYSVPVCKSLKKGWIAIDLPRDLWWNRAWNANTHFDKNNTLKSPAMQAALVYVYMCIYTYVYIYIFNN